MEARKSRGADAPKLEELARDRVAIEGIDPFVDAGRFAAKAVAGRPLNIAADVFGDGHDLYAAAVETGSGAEMPMERGLNDRWTAEIVFPEAGPSQFTILGWRDAWGTWARDTSRKLDAGQDISVELQEARDIIEASKAPRGQSAVLKALSRAARAGDTETLLASDTAAFMAAAGPRHVTRSAPVPVWVDRERAAFSAWYELFPRSQGEQGRHGTFRDVTERLDYVAGLGFDVLYFPPIHPIGTTNRKGRNNSLKAEPGDVGSPYAIGSPEGGMDAVHPELGTLEDFDALVAAARGKGLEIALDIALNASPDHPWIEEHPDWFERRPDGTIKFAENPPKKYEDIVNFRYYLEDGSPNTPFWEAIRDLFLFWIGHGVTIFRVDNPHTKPFPFWEWIIAEVRRDCPGAIFLSEAFTRPKLMKRLAKLGFNQSYTYYTWRNTKAELTEYLTELTTSGCRHYMRPNFFTNTPDINPWFNHTSGRPGFRTRAIMAASLVSNWGLYSGFEFCEAEWLPPKDEYLHSEKYELKHRDLDAPGHIKDDIRLINRLRRTNPAMRDDRTLRFFTAHDDRVLFYGRFDERHRNYLLFHVLIDPHAGARFGFELPLWEFGLPDEASLEVEDAVQGNRFTWHGKNHQLTLDPQTRPYAIWKLFPPGGAA